MQDYVSLLRRNPAYTRLWIAQAISLLGDWFSTIALSALVVEYSGGSGAAVSWLLVARFLPPLIIGPFAGVLVDRTNRKHLLIVSDVARTVIVLLFLTVSNASNLWLIYVLTIIQFSFAALFEPARSAFIPSLVRQDDLVRANVLGSVTWSVMLAAGAAIGGGVAALLGTKLALLIDAMSFALSALCIASIRHISRPAITHETAHLPSQTGFRDGLRYIKRHPTTALVLLIKLGGSIGSIDALIVIYATKMFVIGDQGTGSLGIFYSAFGLGALIGPIVLGRFNNGSVPRMRRLVSVGYAWITIGWFLFGFSPTLLIASFALLIKAMGSSIYWTYSSVILQKTVPDQFLGRLFAIDLAGFQLSTVISVLITGWLIEHTPLPGVPGIVLGTGIVSLIPFVLWTVAIPWVEKQELVAVTGD